jgi:hypothetical protein
MWPLYSWKFFREKGVEKIIPDLEDLNKYNPRRFALLPLIEDPKNFNISPQLEQNYKKRPKWLFDIVGDSHYILIYNREPGWDRSAGKSNRNIKLTQFIEFLKYCEQNNLKSSSTTKDETKFFNIINGL